MDAENQSAKDFHNEMNRINVDCEGREMGNVWEAKYKTEVVDCITYYMCLG